MFSTEEKKVVKYAQLDKWKLIKKLGDGATSRVFLGYDSVNKKYAAIKVLKKLDFQSIELARNEFKTQSALSHPHILSVHNFYETITLIDAENKSMTVTAIAQEAAAGGDILKLMDLIGVFPESLARTYFHQLIDAIEYMSKAEIAHRDIKPENILLDADFCIKLSDFGCVGKCPPKKYFTTAAGTSKYFPPEVHAGLVYQGVDVDLFATAIVLFCMVIGHMPFSKATESDTLYWHFTTGNVKRFWKAHEELLKQQKLDQHINPDFCKLITRMLYPNPSKRIKIEEIKKSAWYNGPILQRSEIIGAIRAKGKKKPGL